MVNHSSGIKRGICTLALTTFAAPSLAALEACREPAFQAAVHTAAEQIGVDYYELLSIVAHESRCQPYAVGWIEPGRPETARSKWFDSAAAAKEGATELIATRKYRVDIGVGQINYEAHIAPKGWQIDDVLEVQSGLLKVAEVLRERGWAQYHSAEFGNAVIWQGAALSALRKLVPGATLRRGDQPDGSVVVKASAPPPFVITADAPPTASPTATAAPGTHGPVQAVMVTTPAQAQRKFVLTVDDTGKARKPEQGSPVMVFGGSPQ
jgi:hypothetical protein